MKSESSSKTRQIAAKRGRPADPARQQRVLEAAQQQFIRHGFVATSMESIAQQAGVSKMTIYKYFSTKEQLFEYCVAARTDQVFHWVEHDAPDDAALPDPSEVLTQIGAQFIALMREPEVLAMHRLLIANSSQLPSVCQTFFQQGCERLTQQVARYLISACAAGQLNISDPFRAADQFLAMHLGYMHLKGLLSLGSSSEADNQAVIRSNVSMFLRAYAP